MSAIDDAILELQAKRDDLTRLIDGLMGYAGAVHLVASKLHPPVIKEERPSGKGFGATAAVREIVNSGRRLNSIQIADMVCGDNPELLRETVSTVISQMIRKGELRKLDDLTVVLSSYVDKG